MYNMRINKNLVHQVGDQTKVSYVLYGLGFESRQV
jgi:hypothetical protein